MCIRDRLRGVNRSERPHGLHGEPRPSGAMESESHPCEALAPGEAVFTRKSVERVSPVTPT